MRLRVLAVLGSALLALTFGAATPAFAASGTVASIAFTPDTVNGGDTTTGTVTLSAAATDDTLVTLHNFAFGLLAAPTSVTVPAGALSASFTATARPITSSPDFACVEATATAGGDVSGCVFVNVVGGPKLIGESFTPPLVAGGGTVTGMLFFSGTTSGVTVNLTSSNPAAASVPAQVTVANRAANVTFPVTTGTVATATPVTITATVPNSSQAATLNVTPKPGAPGSDAVRITKAEWNRGLLRIEASSTNPKAVLTVFFASSPDVAEFTLTSNGGGRYSTQRQWLDNPLPIIVRSTFGGTATSGS